MSKDSDKLFHFVLYAITAVLSVYVLVVAKSILMPLVVSIIVAYLISALSKTFKELPVIGPKIPKWLAFPLSLLAVALVIGVLVNLIVTNVEQVIDRAPQYQKSLNTLLVRVSELLGIGEIPSLAQMLEEVNVRAAINFILDPLTAVASNIFIIIFYVSFLLLERATIRKKIEALVRDPVREKNIAMTLDEIEHKIRKYISIKIFISLITAGFSYLVMAYLGIDFAAFWAVLLFLLNFIPYVGSIIAVAFPVLLTLLQFGSFTIFFVSLGLLVTVQMIASNVIEPKVMGQSLNLSPLMILLALAAWGSIWGILGMIICVPIMVIAMIVFAQFDQTRAWAIVMSQDGQIDGGEALSGQA